MEGWNMMCHTKTRTREPVETGRQREPQRTGDGQKDLRVLTAEGRRDFRPSEGGTAVGGGDEAPERRFGRIRAWAYLPSSASFCASMRAALSVSFSVT